MKCFSLFSGIGGFDLAAQRESHEMVGACEIDGYARQVYQRHFPGVTIYKDARNINTEEIPDFDILFAGFPCQAFSIAGKRLGFEESRGTLFFEIARIAKQKRPEFLLLENVRGLLSHDNGRTFAVILKTLDEIGYDAEWQVINSKYFVPQNRERIFIIGHLRAKSWKPVFPIGEISEINDNESRKGEDRGDGLQDATCYTIDSNYWKGADGKRTMILYRELIQVGSIDQKGHNSLWGRVYDTSGLSSTLCAVGGGMGAKTGLYQTKEGVRRLTPLECERLQGFPDNWTEGLSDTQRYKCIGNAVTVLVIQYILQCLTSDRNCSP